MNLMTKIAAGVALTVGVAFGANAAAITGSIGFGSTANWAPVGVIPAATGFTLTPAAPALNISANGVHTGSFAGIATGTGGSMKDIPNVSAVSPGSPIAGLWTISGFTFNLEHASIIFQTAIGATQVLSIMGDGTISGNGFDATSGKFAWNGNTTDGINFSFSASSSADVPEPMSLAILGVGLLGLGAARRRAAQA